MPRNFKDLSEREILALAIGLEEEDGRVYGDFVDGLRESYPATAPVHAPDYPAGPGGVNGRLRFHSSAIVCRSLRHAQKLGRFPGRSCGLCGGWDFHGFRRGAL